jgi:hypothetical protein
LPDDRLFHKKLGHSHKVNMLSDLEEIAWRTYIQAADDFGVMLYSALPLQTAHERLARHPADVVMGMLERVASVGLIYLFEHQERVYCFQRDWQDFQKIRYALATAHPRIPAALLAHCSIPTQYLHTIWPGGGGRGSKLKNWHPGADWKPPSWDDGSGNVPGTVPGTFQTARARASRDGQTVPRDTLGALSLSIQLEPVPLGVVPPPANTKAPALSRRPVDSLLKTPETPDGSIGGECADVPAALCDCAGADPGDDVDRRRGMEGAHQGPARPAQVRPAAEQRADPPGDGRGGEGLGTEMGAAAGPDAAAANTCLVGPDHPAALASGSDGSPSEGQRLLQATIAHLREQLRMDLPGEHRRRRVRDAVFGPEPNGGADRGVASVDAATALDSHAPRVATGGRGAARG